MQARRDPLCGEVRGPEMFEIRQEEKAGGSLGFQSGSSERSWPKAARFTWSIASWEGRRPLEMNGQPPGVKATGLEPKPIWSIRSQKPNCDEMVKMGSHHNGGALKVSGRTVWRAVTWPESYGGKNSRVSVCRGAMESGKSQLQFSYMEVSFHDLLRLVLCFLPTQVQFP